MERTVSILSLGCNIHVYHICSRTSHFSESGVLGLVLYSFTSISRITAHVPDTQEPWRSLVTMTNPSIGSSLGDVRAFRMNITYSAQVAVYIENQPEM